MNKKTLLTLIATFVMSLAFNSAVFANADKAQEEMDKKMMDKKMMDEKAKMDMKAATK